MSVMLILPKPVKDEIALGYIGRLCYINHKQSLFKMMQALCVHLGLKSTSGAYLTALAMMSDMDVQNFLWSHTLMPVITPDVRVFVGGIGGGWHRHVSAEKNPLRLPKKLAYFCSDCIDQQRQVFGFAYWNRVHQLPGIYWCPWHRKELLCVNGIVMSRNIPPIDDASQLNPPLGYSKDVQHTILHRYGEVMTDFLMHPGRNFLVELAPPLRAKAVALGITVEDKPDGGQYLSDFAFERFPKWWLKKEFKVEAKTVGHYFHPIDDALLGEKADSRTYALAIAMLFDSDQWKSTVGNSGS
jgi:hypothetical protein